MDADTKLTNRDHTRGALVYLFAGAHLAGRYMVRAEKYPEHWGGGTGWYGGRVLWGHDQATKEEALDIARRWVDDGVLPEGA